MKLHIKAGIFLSLFILYTQTGCSSPKPVKKKKPNVILILADDLGYNGIGCYGNEFIQTPNIDQLAKEGMRFTQGYSAAPTCLPSRAALVSGQYSPRTGMYRVRDNFKDKGNEVNLHFIPPANNKGLALEKITIAEAFKAGGYRTAMFGKWHLGWDKKYHPSHQGFDVAIRSHKKHFNFHTEPKVDVPEGAYAADFFTDKAMEFIEESHKQDQPFFLYMPYFLIHGPFEAKQEHIKHFKEKFGDKYPELYILWSAMTKSLDENVGRMTEHLKKLGIDENTIIVFTSDNGGAPSIKKYTDANDFNKPLRDYKGDTYEGGIRVPYIFKWDNKIKANTTCDEAIINLDLYPTLLDMAGVNRPKDYTLDGVSIKQTLLSKGKKSVDRDALHWFYPKYALYDKKKDIWREVWRNIIQTKDGYKLIEYIGTPNRYELFNVRDDISETTDLYSKMPEKAEELKRKMEAWKKSMDAAKPIPNTKKSK